MQETLKTLMLATLLVVCLTADAPGKTSSSTSVNKADKPANSLMKATSQLVVAANQYKKSVETLIPLYETAVTTAAEALEKRKELFAKGLISRRELEAGEEALKNAQAELNQARGQITESDHLLADATAEREAAGRNWAKAKGYSAKAAIMRNEGIGGWVLAQTSKVQTFFESQFGQQLPISAYGQTTTHNRMGLDHRNSVDVALHPDSAEGSALMTYLRSNGVPFLAFRSAVPGAATGAHIHIGYPSSRK
jgi:hypothetical protein